MSFTDYSATLRWLLLMMLAATVVFPVAAANLSGQVKVFNKNGTEALDSFDLAVMYLTGVKSPVVLSKQPVIVDQQDKSFSPRLIPLLVNQPVHFYNREELEHNVFSTEEKNSFDLGRYAKGDFRPVTYPKIGFYKVYCNIHQKMILDIAVFDNPYFALTNAQGQFEIRDVPPGDYQLNAWHIYGGEMSMAVTVGEQSQTTPLISLTSTKVIRDIVKHVDKHGKQYEKSGRYRR